MVETRRALRFKVSKPASIGGKKHAVRCVIRDLSVTGAAIEIASQADVPDRFTLMVSEDNLALPLALFGAEGIGLASPLKTRTLIAR